MADELDYGAAPSLEDIKKKKYRPEYEKQGIPPVEAIPKDKPLDYSVSPEMAAMFGTPEAPKEPEEVAASLGNLVLENKLKIEANLQAAKMLKANPLGQFNQDPRGFVKALVVNHGRTVGEALDILKTQYEMGNQYVRGLPGIDEFINHIPGDLSMSVEKIWEDIAEPVQRVAAGIDLIARVSGKHPLIGGPTMEEIDLKNKLNIETRPTGTAVSIPIPFLGSIDTSVSDMVGALPGLIATGAATEAAVPALTRGAVGLFGGAAVKSAAATVKGGGLLTRSAVSLAGKERLARRVGRLTAEGLGLVGYNLMYGRETTIADMGVTFSGSYLLRKIGSKLAGRKTIDKAYEYLANATGTSAPELMARVTTAEQMINALDAAGAPRPFMNRVIQTGAKTYGAEFGNWLGRWAAKTRKAPEDLDAFLQGIVSEDFRGAARRGYYSTSQTISRLGEKAQGQAVEHQLTSRLLRSLGADDEFLASISSSKEHFSEGAAAFFGRKIALTGEDPSILGPLTKGLAPKYYKSAIDEYNKFLDEAGFAGQATHPKLRWEARAHFRGPQHPPANVVEHLVLDRPLRVGGADKYYPAMSKWHLDNVGRGTGKLEVRGFKNPLEVDYAPNQIPAYAAIAKFKGNPKIAAAELHRLDYLLQNKTNIDLSQTSNIIEGIANRMAKRFGYDSIVYKGATPDRGIFVDLANTQPLEETATQLVEKFERELQRAGRRAAGRNFLSIAGPVVAATAGTQLFAEESQGISVPSGVSKAVAKGLPRTFITMISDLGEQVFGHLKGEPYHAALMKHFPGYEKLKETGSEKGFQQLKDAIQKGFVRGGRRPDGPFVEFNWDNEAARNIAANFLKEHFEPGDIITIDMHKGGSRMMSHISPNLEDVLSTIKSGEKIQRVSRMREFLSIAAPVGVGLGLLTSPDESQAISIGPLLKQAAKFKSLGEMVEGLEPKLSALVKQAAMISGKTSPTEVVQFLGKVQKDVHTLSGGAKVEMFDSGPDFIGINVSHNELPFPLATVRGSVNAHTGTWYPQVRNTPLGFTKKALGRVFEEVKKANPLVKSVANPKSLLGLLTAAAVAHEIYDLFAPSKAEAMAFPTKPIVQMMSKGIRGVGDDVLEDIARSKTVDDVVRVAADRSSAVFNKLFGKDTSNLPIDEAQFLKYDTWGGLEPESQQMLGAADSGEGMNSVYRFRPPGSASENPWWQSFYAQLVEKKDQVLSGDESSVAIARRRGAQIIDESGLAKIDEEELNRAMHGMRRAASGGYVQTEANVIPKINEVAKLLHKDILDPLWTLNTGIDTRAPAIMDDLGLEQTVANWQLIKKVQLKAFDEPRLRGVDAKHQAAALAMQGMINTKPWQWKNLNTPYAKAKYIIRPIEQEMAELKKLINHFKEMYGDNPPPDVAKRVMPLAQRLKYLQEKEKRPLANLPTMDRINDYRFQPFDGTRGPDIPMEVREKDPNKLLARHIDGALSKMFFDEQNTYARTLVDYFQTTGPDGLQIESAQLGDYIKEFMNTLNGVKAMKGDTRIASTINSIISPMTDKRISVRDVRKYANGILEFTYLSKLGVGLRWPLVNITQPLQTTSMITGLGPLARAYGKVINDMSVWDEARAAGVLKAGTSRAMSEIESLGPRGQIGKMLDYIPNKAENLNRVVTYQAGKDWALGQLAKTGTVKVPHFVRTFNRQVLSTGDPDKIAREVGAALVRTTQFMFGVEGRPVALSGGAARRVITQFKSFTAAYTDLMVGAFEHGKRTGDWAPAMRGVTALVLFGGVTAVPGFGLAYGAVRRELIKRGYSNVPDEDESGLGYLISTSAAAFGTPDTADQVKEAMQMLQLTGSFSMLDIGLGRGDVSKGLLGFLAGPTVGPLVQGVGGNAIDYARGEMTADKAFRGALGAVSQGPVGAAGLEALQMAGYDVMNSVAPALHYRGGIYSDTGKLLARQQSTLGVLARALNLQPSLRSQRYKYLRDIGLAYEGGQTALAQRLTREAQRLGFIIDKEAIAQAKGTATRKKNERKPNEPLR